MFMDRADAGRRLAARLSHLQGADVVVVGLPRGGVPVAYEVARALDAPLDVIGVRKLGVPGHAELAMGAVGEDGVVVTNPDVLSDAGVSRGELAAAEARETATLEERLSGFRAVRAPVPLDDRVVVVVDDGVATGATARATCRVARARGARSVILAVPVIAASVETAMHDDADDVVAVESPAALTAVGLWYEDFSATGDAEVRDLLAAAAEDRPDAGIDQEVDIEADGVRLRGHLVVPSPPRGLVIFAHGSGSSRMSPRNAYVAEVLQQAGLATLLFDLLTPDEEGHREAVFDIGRLARRLTVATGWAASQSWVHDLDIGWFGASTGAAAALHAAAEPDSRVTAIVSRGGRPDLAGGDRLSRVHVPTLLIVGGDDPEVLRLNEAAAARLSGVHRIVVVPGATHLFEEPGTLEIAARHARDWFTESLRPPDRAAA